MDKNKKLKIMNAADSCAKELYNGVTVAEVLWGADKGRKLGESIANIRVYLDVEAYLKLLPACFRASRLGVPKAVQHFAKKSNTEEAIFFASNFALIYEGYMEFCFYEDTHPGDGSTDKDDETENEETPEQPCEIYVVVIPTEVEK